MESLFSQVLSKIRDGQTIVFNRNNVAPGDDFIIFSACDTVAVTFHTRRVPYWIDFEGDEPMRLEDVPESFLRSILLNV